MKFWTLHVILLFGLESALLGQPAITKQPENQTASLFADALFSLLVSGDPPLSFQWRFNNADLNGMTNRTLTVTNVQRSNAGNYQVIVSNPSGSVTSQVALLTIVPFNAGYFFGFSWTDTDNCGWEAPSWYRRRASNGPMWPDFLSPDLGLGYSAANNFANCGATSQDVLDQTAAFRSPAKPGLALYFLWGGDSEFLRALPPDGVTLGYLNVTNEPAWNKLIQTAVLNNSNAVNRLYTKGARAIVIETSVDFSKLPGVILALGGNSAALSRLSNYVAQCNVRLEDLAKSFSAAKKDIRVIVVDVYTKLNALLADASSYGFTNTTNGALYDLTDHTFTGPGANYVFWDNFHGTSKLNELIAAWHLEALTNAVLETLEATIASAGLSIRMNHLMTGRDCALQSSADLSSWGDMYAFTANAGTNSVAGLKPDSRASYFRLKWVR